MAEAGVQNVSLRLGRMHQLDSLGLEFGGQGARMFAIERLGGATGGIGPTLALDGVDPIENDRGGDELDDQFQLDLVGRLCGVNPAVQTLAEPGALGARKGDFSGAEAVTGTVAARSGASASGVWAGAEFRVASIGGESLFTDGCHGCMPAAGVAESVTRRLSPGGA